MNDRHSIAKQIDDIAKVQAAHVEAAIKSNEILIRSIKDAFNQVVTIVTDEIIGQNKTLAALATAIRDGTVILPPAPQLAVVNADAVVDDRQERAA